MLAKPNNILLIKINKQIQVVFIILLISGYAHIHGSAWSDFDILEETYPGLQKTFLKLKQRKRLDEDDISPLLQFGKDTITCSTDPKVLMSQFGINRRRADKIVKMVKEVNTHHHTKTCRKYKTDCRFKFPRYPSLFYTAVSALHSRNLKYHFFWISTHLFFIKENLGLHEQCV